MERDYTIVGEDSPIFQALHLTSLLGNAVSLTHSKITIYVRDSYAKDTITPDLEKIARHYGKPVNILIREDYFREADVRPVAEGRLKGFHYFTEEYMDTPFFEGKSNYEAINYVNRLINDKSGILVISGDSGTGKSHLLQSVAKRMMTKGATVYVNTANNTINEMKEFFDKVSRRREDPGRIGRQTDEILRSGAGRKTFHEYQLDDVDMVFIDDIQTWNRTHLAKMFDAIFALIEYCFHAQKKIIMTSDVRVAALTALPDRILTRLQSWYLARMDLPGSDIKSQYLDHFCLRHNIQVSAQIREHIIEVSPSLRILRAALNMAALLKTTEQELTLELLAEKINALLGVPPSVRQEKDEKVYFEVHSALSEYLGISPAGARYTGSRKMRVVARLDNIMYYLFKDRIARQPLLKRLNISSSHAMQAGRRGEQEFKKLPSEIQNEIQHIMGESK